MATVDFSSYHQPPTTVGDGTKFDNFIDAVQAQFNGGIDTNNIAAGAGIKGSQIATGLNGPAGTQLVKDQATINSASISATTEGTAVSIITGSSFTYDGATEVKIEFWAPTLSVTVAPTTITWVLLRGATVLGQAFYTAAATGFGNPSPYVVFHETPPAAASAYTLKAFVNANAVTVAGGAGGSGVALKAFLKATKV